MATWGITQDTSFDGSAAINWARSMWGTFNGGTGQELVSVSVHVTGVESQDMRIAVYENPTALDNIDGAVLIADSGVIAASEGWNTYNLPAAVALTNGEDYGISMKSNDGAFDINYFTSATGDFQSARGRATGAQSSDETAAWEDPIVGTGVFGNFWYPYYFTYQAASSALPGYHASNRGINRGVNRGVG